MCYVFLQSVWIGLSWDYILGTEASRTCSPPFSAHPPWNWAVAPLILRVFSPGVEEGKSPQSNPSMEILPCQLVPPRFLSYHMNYNCALCPLLTYIQNLKFLPLKIKTRGRKIRGSDIKWLFSSILKFFSFFLMLTIFTM